MNLALFLAQSQHVALFDLDVEEPNDNHFLHLSMTPFQDVSIQRPVVDESICTYCGQCAELCEFNALAVLPKQVLIFNELCHGCGLCSMSCPAKAITEKSHKLGTIKQSSNLIVEEGTTSKSNLKFYEGTLNVGEALATPLIKEMKKIAFKENFQYIILDLPPGSACPVIEGLSESDFVVLVTEPTPAGEHDLRIAIDVVNQLNIPFGIVNNRANVGDDCITRLVESGKYHLLIEIPHSNEVLHLYSHGLPLIGTTSKFDDIFAELWNQILEGMP